MLTVQVKLNVEDIIASLGTLNQAERKSCDPRYLNFKKMVVFARR